MSRPPAMGCTSTKKGLRAPVTYPHTITGSSTSPSQREINRIYDQTIIPPRRINHLPSGANLTECQHPPFRDVAGNSRGTSHSTSEQVDRIMVLESDKETLRKRHDHEVNRLCQEVGDAQARLAHEQSMSAELKQRYRDRVNAIEQEHQQQLGGLRARMKELENENEVLQRKREEWEAQNALLCDKVQETHRQENDELVMEVKSLREDNEAYRASLEQYRSGESRERKTKAQYEQQFRAWRAGYVGQLSRLREASKQLQEAVSQRTEERDLLASNLTIATTSNETKEMNIEMYKKELKDLQKRCDEDVSRLRGELEKVAVEKDQAVTGLERLKKRQGADVEQVEAYKQQLHALQHSHTDEISRLRSKLQKLTQEKNQAVASLGELEEHHTDDAKQITSYKRQLQDLQERYDGEIGRLQQKCQEANNDLSRVTHEKEKAIADLASLYKRISTDAKQMEIYKHQFRDLQQSNAYEVRRIRQALLEITKDKERADADLEISRCSSAGQTSTYKRQLQDLQQSFTEEVSTLRSKLQNVTQEKEQAVASLVQLEANRTDDAKQITSYKRRLQDLQQRYDEETNRMRREQSISKNVMAQLVQERDRVVADLSGLEKKHESELYQLQIHNQQLSDLKKKRDEEIMKCHQGRNDRSQANLSSSTSERDQALGDLSRTTTRHAVDKRNITQYTERFQLLQTSNNTNDDANQK